MNIKLLFVSTLILFNESVLAESSLQFKPVKCVTLKQGNTCYQDIKISWQSDSDDRFCLFNSSKKEPVKCWDNVKEGDYAFEFVGQQSVDYKLVNMSKKMPIAKQHFSVKWVYKARPNNRWRLF